MKKIGYFDKVSESEIEEINFTELLSESISNEELDKLFQRMYEGDVNARGEIIERHLHIVKELVDHNCDDPFSDKYQTLFSNGVINLIYAVDHYSKERDCSFSRYAKYLCHFSVFNGLSGKNKALDWQDEGNCVLVDANVMSFRQNFLTVDKYLEYSELIENLYKAISLLDDVERKCIEYRFMENLNMDVIKQKVGLNTSTIRSKIRDGIDKLKYILTSLEKVNCEDRLAIVIDKLLGSNKKYLEIDIKLLNFEQLTMFRKAVSLLPPKHQDVVRKFVGLDDQAIRKSALAKIHCCGRSEIQRIIDVSFIKIKSILKTIIFLENLNSPFEFNFIEWLLADIKDAKWKYSLLTQAQKDLFESILDEFQNSDMQMVKLYFGTANDTCQNMDAVIFKKSMLEASKRFLYYKNVNETYKRM